MNDGAMRAEAVAVKDGRILAVGTTNEVMAHRGKATEVIDLGGRALLPGFVDSHGHVFMGGLQALSANLLAPPDGGVKDIVSLQQAIRDWMAANRKIVERIDLVIGFGYTTAQEGRTQPSAAEVLRAVANEGGLAIDVVAYSDVLADRGYMVKNVARAYQNRYRLGGALSLEH